MHTLAFFIFILVTIEKLPPFQHSKMIYIQLILNYIFLLQLTDYLKLLTGWWAASMCYWQIVHSNIG